MHKIVVTTGLGLEELLAQEILDLIPNAELKQKPGQVALQVSLEQAYLICLWSRLANRVLWHLDSANIANVDDLYDLGMRIDWQQHFNVHTSFAVDFFGTNRLIKNTQFGALKLKDAIVDQFNEELQRRPDVDKHNPGIRIHARLHRDQVSVFLDLSGASLHMRHYRQQKGIAPLRENLAFAMLMRSGWTKDTDKPLCDPMCGSGTIAIEAALYKANIAPGLKRESWGFTHWLQHNEGLWLTELELAKSKQDLAISGIFASDFDARLVKIAKENAQRAGIADCIKFDVKDATHLSFFEVEPGYVVCNPPYGERLGELTSLIPLFKAWGTQLKSRFADWQLALLTSNRDLLRQLRLVADKSYKFKNANLDCELVLYKMDSRNCQVLEGKEGSGTDFANRLKKNLSKLQKWINNQDTDCYRVYDADLPDYNVAIDRYGDWVVVNEYAAPKNIPRHKTIRRLHEVLSFLPEILQVDPANIVLKVREVKKGKNQYERISKDKQYLKVQENGATFLVNLHDYLDTGLFLDHREVRQTIRAMSKGKDVLNLFAYTGTVSVFAAMGGAKSVTTVDMSNTYLEWAKRNFSENKLRYGYHFIKADCTEWLHAHHEKYDLIFIDPPSFSNSKSMQGTWDVQRDHMRLLKDARERLKSKGVIIFSNNLRSFKLDENIEDSLQLSVENITTATIPEDFKRNQKIHHCWKLTAKD